MNPAIVLGCDANGYGIIRSINKFNKNIPIIGIDYNPKSPGLYSRFLKHKFVISNPFQNNEKSIDEFLSIIKKLNNKPVLYITSDLFLSFINKYRFELEKKALFNVPKKDLLDNILDKRKQYDIISKINVPFPKTYHIEFKNLYDVYDLDIEYPIFIKGAYQFQWKKYFNEKGFVANSKQELELLIKKIKEYNIDIVVQELILGPNYNHYKISVYYDKTGELKLVFTTQKTRQFPQDFGVGCYMKSKRMNEIIELGRKIFENIFYNGIGSIEFKFDERDRKYKLIEINPRVWQQNYQATVAGLNFAEYYYKDLVGEKIEFNDKFIEGVTYIDTVNDFQSFVINKKITGEKYFDWIKQVVTADSYSFFYPSDPLPILKSSNLGLKLIRYFMNILLRAFK
ncbi:MAG: hypothetical protein QXR30_03935 [Candidatus Woesearchaeota archaeon]